jgi:acetyl-CoA synthetase
MEGHGTSLDAVNVGDACTWLQCALGRAEKVAFRWVAPGGTRSSCTFADLERESGRAAWALRAAGLAPADVVFTFLPKMPEQFFAFLGGLRARVLMGTLFSNFGEDALVDRLADAGARAVITRKSLVRKILAARARVPSLRQVFVVDLDDDVDTVVRSWPRMLAAQHGTFAPELTRPEEPSMLHYTSGSTGRPKGVVHVHGGLVSQRGTTAEVLGLREDDVYWCTADQGWVTGTSYGIIGPWSLGVTQVHYGGGYDPEVWLRTLEEEGVTVWYTAPTALRMLSREPRELFAGRDLSRLRAIFSVGEPLNPPVIAWGREVLGKEIHDTWFQTETGAIMIANRPGMEIRPGSMGREAGGVAAAVLGDDGEAVAPGTTGHLCLKAGWPSMFRSYLGDASAYASRFRRGWYYTGDTVRQDEEGYFWFLGRSDDVINTAGHLVSPFEVESALLEVPEIAECGAIGAPDELLYEKVVVFVRLRSSYQFTPELALKLRLHVANRVSSVANPQEVIAVDAIPKNRSGKILRRVLKARYAGADAGDVSTMEGEP